MLFRRKEKKLNDHVKAFSQFEEEKILSELIKTIPEIVKTYVDIGASDGVRMSNTARLALEGWQGFAFEYDFKKVGDFTKHYCGLKNVSICNTKITPKNILHFLKGYLLPVEFGFLSLDIDSYDYFVLEQILSAYRPTILLVEINEKIPTPLEFTVLFNEAWGWDGSHFYGQSISQVGKLAQQHGYSIAALEYNNLFLVASEHYRGIPLTPAEAYEKGYLSKNDRLEKYPWNQDMEALLAFNPQEGIEFLHEKFAPYNGLYTLK